MITLSFTILLLVLILDGCTHFIKERTFRLATAGIIPLLGALPLAYFELFSFFHATLLTYTLSFFLHGFVVISGGHLHSRKDGGPDRRYKYNPYIYSFSEKARSRASEMAITVAPFPVLSLLILYFL